MTLTPQWLDELRARTMLSTLIGKSVKVTRAGREYKACCPFHNEKTPSFTINDDKGFYHCFGCGAHGDAIRWMTEQRGLPFMDAVKELAASAGMDVPAPDPRAAARAEAAATLRDVTEASALWFRERLADNEGADARAYLAKRGLTAATIATFALGFAPDARGRLRETLRKYGDALAVESGMLIQPPEDAPKDRQTPYDRFRGRLMIPIRDPRGRTIAFGGRILGSGEPKYLNSPDTPLFDKGRTLYNLDRAAPAARKAGRLIVVEGYMDVIALAQVGIEEAVAPLGTALTEQQIDLAWRQVQVPILAFDGDAAGQRAALRAATRALPILRPGHSLSFLTLPAGQDPDDIVRSGGAVAFDALAASPMPLVDLLWQTAFVGRGNDTPEARAAVRSQLFEWAGAIADKDVAAHYRQAFRDRLDDAFFAQRPRPQRAASPLRRDGKRGFAPPERAPTASLRRVGETIDARLIDAVVAGLLRYPARIAPHAEALARLPVADSATEKLLATMVDTAFAHQSGLDSAGLLTILADTAVYNKAQALLRADIVQFSFTHSPKKAAVKEAGDTADQEDAATGEWAQRDLDEAIATLVAWPEVERALAAATDAARERLDETSFAEQQRLLRMKAELAGKLAGLAESARL
jgi:DNA primase